MKEVDGKLTEVSDETVIWKYMDFFQFMDLIINRKLFFSRLSKLEDAQECCFINEEIKLIVDDFKNKEKDYIVDCFRRNFGIYYAIDSKKIDLIYDESCEQGNVKRKDEIESICRKGLGVKFLGDISDDEISEYLEKNKDSPHIKEVYDKYRLFITELFIKRLIDVFIECLKSRTLVSCWFINEKEDYAMWKIYGNKGIAIKTTVGKLKKTLSSEDIQYDKVIYLDPDAPPRKGSELFLSMGENELMKYKLNHYSYEKEFRTYFTIDEKVLSTWFPEKEEDIEGWEYVKNRMGPGNEFYSTCLDHIHSDNTYGAKIPTTGEKLDLDELIEEIYVSPLTPKWQYSLIARFINENFAGFDISNNLIFSGIKLNG